MQFRSLGREDPDVFIFFNIKIFSYFYFIFFNILSIVAWRIPWTEEPGGLWSIGLQRVRHDGSDLAHMHSDWGEVITL